MNFGQRVPHVGDVSSDYPSPTLAHFLVDDVVQRGGIARGGPATFAANGLPSKGTQLGDGMTHPHKAHAMAA
jgi:hypothetical protein